MLVTCCHIYACAVAFSYRACSTSRHNVLTSLQYCLSIYGMVKLYHFICCINIMVRWDGTTTSFQGGHAVSMQQVTMHPAAWPLIRQRPSVCRMLGFQAVGLVKVGWSSSISLNSYVTGCFAIPHPTVGMCSHHSDREGSALVPVHCIFTCELIVTTEWSGFSSFRRGSLHRLCRGVHWPGSSNLSGHIP